MSEDQPPTPAEFVQLIWTGLKHYLKSPQERPKWTDEAMVILTVLIALGGFLSAWLIVGQLREARTATQVTNCALQRSIESFRTDERAWVEIGPIKPNAPEHHASSNFGLSFTYEISLKNLGKTAAHNVSVKTDTFAHPREANADTQWVNGIQDGYLPNARVLNMEGEAILAPGNPVPKVLAPGSTASRPFILKASAPLISSTGESVNYLIGRVDYVDEFKVQHWLKFCFYVANRQGELWNCEKGNEEDENPEVSLSQLASCPGP
jgi:hypothetical protein